MRLASKGGIGLGERETFRLFRLRKRIRQFFKYRSGRDKTALFTVGCRRNGTSSGNSTLPTWIPMTRPAEVMVETYRFIDRPWPGDRIVADVFSASKGLICHVAP